jgi:predicted AAA+ superfamily ATPase
MDKFLPRALASVVEKSLTLFPVVVLTGARQTGKSTLVRDLDPLSKRTYLTLDSTLNRTLATAEPKSLLEQAGAGRLTIDEVQRAPDLLLSIKESVDRSKAKGRFLLTGSANLLLMQRVSESLAGRARYLTLWPMTRREQLGQGTSGIWSVFYSRKRKDWLDVVDAESAPREAWETLAARGGYPEAALLHRHRATDSDRHEIFTGYTQTYLERDLRDLAAIDNLYDFQRLMRAACLRLGTVINQVELGRDTGLPRSTVQRYLNLLEVSYQLVRLEPYSVNRTKRLVKTPKLYWSDTGLALHLSQQSAPSGAHLENVICTDLLAWRETDAARPAILYWRTSTGDEVDFVVEREGKLLPIEVKASANPGYNDSKGLRTFLAEYGKDVIGGLLLHGGDETFWISDGVLAAPWWKVI